MYVRLPDFYARFSGLGEAEIYAAPLKEAADRGSFGSISVKPPFDQIANKDSKGKITGVPASIAEGYSFLKDLNGRWYPVEDRSLMKLPAGPSVSLEEMKSSGQARTWDGKLVALINVAGSPIPGSPGSQWIVGQPGSWYMTQGYKGDPVISEGIPGKGYWTQIFGASNAKIRMAPGLQVNSDTGGYYLVAGPQPGFASGGGRVSASMTVDQIKDKAILRTYDGRIGLILSYDSPPASVAPLMTAETSTPAPIKTAAEGTPTPVTTSAQGTPTPLEPSVKVVYVEPPKPDPAVSAASVTPAVVQASKEVVTLDTNKKLIIGFSAAALVLLAIIYKTSG